MRLWSYFVFGDDLQVHSIFVFDSILKDLNIVLLLDNDFRVTLDFRFEVFDRVANVAGVSILTVLAEIHELTGERHLPRDRLHVAHQSRYHLLDHLDHLDEVLAFLNGRLEHVQILVLNVILLVVLEHLLMAVYLDHKRPERLFDSGHTAVFAAFFRHD